MGIIDAFVYAHNYHRHSVDNPGNLRTAWRRVTPSYKPSASQDANSNRFRLPRPSTRTFQPIAPPRGKKATTFRDGRVVFTDGRSHVSETTAGWGAVARSPDGKLYVMFGPVITTEAHLAFAGAGLHTNNTAELLGFIEALSFLGPGPVARGSQACIFMVNECADHGAALGALSLIHSSCDFTTLFSHGRKQGKTHREGNAEKMEGGMGHKLTVRSSHVCASKRIPNRYSECCREKTRDT